MVGLGPVVWVFFGNVQNVGNGWGFEFASSFIFLGISKKALSASEKVDVQGDRH